MELPKVKIPALYRSPRKMLIYSAPKVGKTTVGAMLDNALILDLEEGSDFIDALKVPIKKIADIRAYGEEIIKQGRPYQYGIVDTTTKLEDMILPMAGKMYQNTPMGKNWGKLPNGEDDPTANILTLPNGGGYLYLREAYNSVTAYIDTLFPRQIYFGHLKDKSIEKNGKEVSAKDIDLTGKIRNIACAGADAIGYMYREGNQTVISFKTTQEVICGARPEHLRNQEIIVLEQIDGKFISHWDRIYID
jgi:hypothetical protein